MIHTVRISEKAKVIPLTVTRLLLWIEKHNQIRFITNRENLENKKIFCCTEAVTCINPQKKVHSIILRVFCSGWFSIDLRSLNGETQCVEHTFTMIGPSFYLNEMMKLVFLFQKIEVSTKNTSPCCRVSDI